MKINTFGILPLIITIFFMVVNSEEKSIKMQNVQLHPDYPVVEGNYKMTKDWSVFLPGKFNRRIEDGSLVLWRPGFTIWTIVWNNDKNESIEKRRNYVIKEASPQKFYEEFSEPDSLFYSYRLYEDEGDKRVAAFYCFAFGDNGHVQMAIYFDKEDDVIWAKKIWRSLKENISTDKK